MSLRRNEDSEVEEEEAALLGAPTGRVGDGGRRRSDSREPAIDCRLAALLLLFLGVAISAASRIAALRLAASNVDPAASDGGGGYSVVPEIVLKGLAGAVRTQAGAVDALLRESREVGTEVEMALRDQARARESAAAAAAPPTSSAAPPAAGLPLPLPTRACPEGCTEHGNCNELTGECTCGLTRRGPACQEPTMPACMLGGRGAGAPSASPGGVDEVINLSFLVAESFWGGLRDVRTDDPRRKKVAHRWVGMVTCDCVEQALAVLSLSRASAPPRFPERIGHTELSLQRALCIDDPRPVGQLWEEGVAAGAKWSYVPLVAWLKPFPAHAPHLLPLHLVNEAHWVDIPKKDPHLMRLRRNPIELLALARARRDGGRPRVSLKAVLRLGPSDGHLSDGPALVPLRRCGAHQCHRAGWCGGWDAKAAPPRCQCLSRWSAVSEAVARAPEERVDVSVALRRVGRGRGAAAECAPQPRAWVQGMDRAAYARSHEQMEAADAERNWLGEDRWRSSVAGRPRTKACPNECLGRGSCAFGFCHCRAGFWGLDCGLSRARVASLAAEASPGPRIYVYEVPAMLRRSCGPWRFPEDLGDAILSSRHLTVRPDQADLFWIYGCPNGDIVMPMLRWVKHSAGPWWNASVAAGRPRHVLSLPHEEGWAEVWVLLRSWLAFGGDHGNSMRGWDDLHPASPTRQLVCLQLHGSSDYTPAGSPPPRRGVSGGAACRICFQPGKDVVVPGFPSIMDYPADYSHSGRATQCEKLAAARTSTARTDRSRTPRLFFAGVVQTKSHGPGLYEASRLVLYSCWKNRSSEHGFSITQTENVLVSVNQWEVEPPVDAFALTRQASTCVVPEGKIGSYGHRAVPALLLGCVPVLTKERHSHGHFDEVLPWSRIALHVPPSEVPRLPQLLDEAPIEAMRTAAAPLLRRLLWVSIYGACHLLPGEGGTADALDTLLEVLRRPRSHFTPPTAAPDRAPEFLKELFPWLRSRGAPECTRGYQCFDEHSRSCGLPRGAPTVYVPPRK